MVRLALQFGWVFAALFAVWLAVLTFARASGPEGLLVNGGFEDGDSGWNGNVIGGSIVIVDAPVAEGTRAALLSIDPDQLGLRAFQPVAAGPGGRYTLTGQILIDDLGVLAASIEIRWFSPNSGFEQATSPPFSGVNDSYHQVMTPEAIIPCDATNVQVAIVLQRSPSATTAQAYFDDLHLKSTGAVDDCPAATPSPTASPPATETPVPSATSTRTSTPTRTPTDTRTPTPTRTETPTRTPTGTHTPAATPTVTATSALPASPSPTRTATLVAPPPTPSNGLLVNGGFEAADGAAPIGWRTFGGELTQAPSPVRSGEGAGCFASSTSSTKWVFQTVAVDPSAWYEFEGYVLQNDPLVQAAWLRISWYPSVDGTGSALATVDSTAQLDQPGPDFRYLATGPAQAPLDAHSASARIMLRPVSSSEAVICMDDLFFNPAATPPTATPTPTATASSTPTAAAPPPTRTPTRTATATPVALPTVLASPTAVASPRAEIVATPTPDLGAPATATPTPPIAAPPEDELLANGGFEDAQDGELSGWSSYGGLLTQVSEPAHGGQFAAALFSSSNSTKWAYETVLVTATQWYQMDAFVLHDHPGVESAWLRVSWYASDDGSGSALASVDSLTQLDAPIAGYRQLTTGPMQAPPGVRSAKARVVLRPRSAGSALIYIDDVSLRTVAALDPPGGDGLSGDAPSAGSDDGYVPPRGSSGAGVSQVLGASMSRPAPLPPQATPVIRRHPLLASEENVLAGGEGGRRWLWAIAAAVTAAGVAGSAAYRWGWRRQHS